MTKQEAEEYVYASYLKATPYQNYAAKDAEKRHPELTRGYLRSLSKTPCVVVTGSKGKGSVTNMIAKILEPYFHVGLMTSPHILDFCERFKVDGVQISDEQFVKVMQEIKSSFDEIQEGLSRDVCISPMGIQAAVGLKFFQKARTEFNVFECGKGAQYDDVNNIPHQYAVINSIFLEHTRELGSTLEEIASDKAHVINGEQKCVYAGPQADSVMQVIESRATEYGVPLKCYGRDFSARNIRYTESGMVFDVVTNMHEYPDLRVPLLGEHQARNCALAVALCEDVVEKPGESFLQGNDEDGMLRKTTLQESQAALHWPGRMEILSQNPFMLLDACINRTSAEEVLKTLRALDIKDITCIIGIPDDKDFLGVTQCMQQIAKHIILTRSQNPHYVFTIKQKDILEDQGIKAEWMDSLKSALELAKRYDDKIIILGTTSVVGEVALYIRKMKH